MVVASGKWELKVAKWFLLEAVLLWPGKVKKLMALECLLATSRLAYCMPYFVYYAVREMYVEKRQRELRNVGRVW